MTKKKLLFKNGLLVDPKNEVEFIGSLLVEKGIIKKGENVIFMFTGGSPAVFAYNDEIANNSTQ